MHNHRRIVSKKKKEITELPHWATEGAIWVQKLFENGCLKKLEEQFQVYRKAGGFVGIDVALFFIFFFCSKSIQSLKIFGELSKPFRKEMAALGGRKNLPTPAAISRFLSVVGDIECEGSDWSRWLLLEACEAKEALTHKAACTYDTHGQAWHFFDWDGTNTTLRRRALPSAEDLPEPKRRSETLAKPGYTARKRGEVLFSRAVLQHSGTGLWIDAVSKSTRADIAGLVPSALKAIQNTCQYANIPLDRAVIRADGSGGGKPWIETCQKHGVHYLTRIARYNTLEDIDVKEHLKSAVWTYVPSSQSGPTRMATDLGYISLRSPNSSDDSIQTRVVVSRFASPSKKKPALATFKINGNMNYLRPICSQMLGLQQK